MPAPKARPFVLLVEDSDDDVFFFQRTLKKTGQPCTFVHLKDGDVAMAYLTQALASPQSRQDLLPDLIFLDLKLPTYSGFELLEWLHEQKATPLNVTILSGSDHRGDVERAKALGASSYAVKPLSLEDLRSRLEQWHAQHPAPATS